jgi:pimeloyl-ACP methyl ester carboxylesterase
MHRAAKRVTVISAVLAGLFAFEAIAHDSELFAQARRGRVRELLQRRRQDRDQGNVEKIKVAGLDVAVWRPATSEPAPLIVFSHGFTGCNTQSVFLMQALAKDGDLVVAPNHADAACEGRRGLTRPEEPFRNAKDWNENTHRNRARDIQSLIDAMRRDRTWNVNWSQVGLAGHSLGGYTVLGLAGGWPSWRLNGVSVDAVLALSPYCDPFADHGDLGGIRIPVMYQGGTRDIGITPKVKARGGCYDKTSSPATFVEFQGAGHLAWSDLTQGYHDIITRYSIAFLDQNVRGKRTTQSTQRESGVSDFRSK